MSVATAHFICLPCRVYQRGNNVCSECNAVMGHGTFCRCCGERAAATGADECIECICDEVRLDSSVIDGIHGALKDQVLAHMRAPVEPTYQPGFMFKRQAGGM